MAGSREWSKLDVSEPTRSFIKGLGFSRMTPVQAITIPLLLNRRDVAVEAATGSGKTLAFLIPVVEMLLKCERPSITGFNVGCIILAPTRELAGQIHEVLAGLVTATSKARIGHMLLVGGSDAKGDVEQIVQLDSEEQMQALVATPGRLCKTIDLAGKVSLNMKCLEVLILDEADRLLQLGFSTDLEQILTMLPKQRRTGLFSATLTSELQQLMKTGMRNPVHVCVKLKRQSAPAAALEDGKAEDGKTPDALAVLPSNESKAIVPRHEVPTKLSNFFVELPAHKRMAYLVQFLKSAEVRRGKTVVFFTTCACVDFFHTILSELVDGRCRGPQKKNKNKKKSGPTNRIERLHGQMAQVARTKAYEKFRTSPLEDGCVLLSTDLAARGIDIENVSWVVQFDAPQDPAAFVHRIGRTARAGKSGKSLLIHMPHEDAYISFLRQRGIAIDEMPPLEPPPGQNETAEGENEARDAAILKKAKKIVETDRVAMKQATDAFMSFMRAYKEHELTFLFPMAKLDIGRRATGYCLLRLPRIKEIMGKHIENFEQSQIKPHDVPLRNKKQEKQRKERFQQALEDEKAEGGNGVVAVDKWASTTELIRKENSNDVTDIMEFMKPKVQRTKTAKRRCKRIEKAEEWDMLQKEECLAKKLKKGKITAAEFAKREAKLGRYFGKNRKAWDAKESEPSESDDDSDAKPNKKKKKKGNDAASMKAAKRDGGFMMTRNNKRSKKK